MVGLVPTTHRAAVCKLPIKHSSAMHTLWVYILASKPNGTPYIGVTKFTSRFAIGMLVYYEAFGDIEQRSNAKRRSSATYGNGRST